MVLWCKGGDVRELFPLRYDIFKPALLNDANQVVFCERRERRLSSVLQRLFPPRIRYYLWDSHHGRVPLDSCARVRHGEAFSPMDINNHGWIVGIVDSGAHARAVLLEPVPERWTRVKKSPGSGEKR